MTRTIVAFHTALLIATVQATECPNIKTHNSECAYAILDLRMLYQSDANCGHTCPKISGKPRSVLCTCMHVRTLVSLIAISHIK